MMLRLSSAIAIVLFVATSSARLAHHENKAHVSLGRERLETEVMHMYRDDCWTSQPVSSEAAASAIAGSAPASPSFRGSSLAQAGSAPASPSFRGSSLAQAKNPGAGLGSITPYVRVLKDGFYQVGCYKDYMFESGDKFGDNRHSYKLGSVSNVSIVLYERNVEKEDREAMTHKACFSFCRTVPDMLYFGVVNGRECYCTPYFQPQESDSSSCDATCEGDAGSMCGGKTKSSIFQMHMCSNTAQDLTDSKTKMVEVKSSLEALGANITGHKNSMQAFGASLQEKFGKVGDPDASDLCQQAKVRAGELEHAVEDATRTVQEMATLKGAAETAVTADFTRNVYVVAAEDMMDQMESASTKGDEQAQELEDLLDLTAPVELSSAAVVNASQQYYNVMYFVDAKNGEEAHAAHAATKSTCTGEVVDKPLSGNLDFCAAACNRKVHSNGGCVGFQFMGTEATGLCFLFSKFHRATRYNCASPPINAVCMAKLSKFEGTTLKPDASGKCDQCLKKVTEADRCYS